jgi:hypothetical protein
MFLYIDFHIRINYSNQIFLIVPSGGYWNNIWEISNNRLMPIIPQMLLISIFSSSIQNYIAWAVGTMSIDKKNLNKIIIIKS